MESTTRGVNSFVKSFTKTAYALVGKEKGRGSINWSGNPLCLKRYNTSQFGAYVYGDYNDIYFQIYACGY